MGNVHWQITGQKGPIFVRTGILSQITVLRTSSPLVLLCALRHSYTLKTKGPQVTRLNTFQQVRELQDWQAKLFAAALTQRMLPNYQLFCEATSFEGTEDMVNLTNLLWEVALNPKTKVNFAVQLEKIEQATPDIKDFDNYGVYPALDFAVALEAAFNLLSGEDPQGAVVISKISQGCVEAFIDATSEQPLDPSEMKTHPAMQREIEFQQQMLARLNRLSRRDSEQLKALRQYALEDGASNIGIAADEQ